MSQAAKDKRDIYAGLYELEDKQLEDGLKKLGKRAHVVLANGSVKKKGEDQNAPARKALALKIDLFNRMISPRALGHNKFLVLTTTTTSPAGCGRKAKIGPGRVSALRQTTQS